MKGLLYKEVASLMGLYKKNLVLVAVIYGALSVVTRNNFFLFFGIWMMGFYSLSSFSLDDASGWGRYARTLPISDKQIVGAKFLAALIFMALALVYALVIGAVCWAMDSSSFAWADFLAGVLLVTAVALLSVGLMFYFAVKFGPEKSRNYFMVAALAVFAVFFLAGQVGLLEAPSEGDLAAVLTWMESHMVLVPLAAIALAGLVFFLCYLASCAVYRRKEF